jgi:hypothetical protein
MLLAHESCMAGEICLEEGPGQTWGSRSDHPEGAHDLNRGGEGHSWAGRLYEEMFRRSRLQQPRHYARPPKCCSSYAGFGRLNVGICLMLIAPADVGTICATSLEFLTALHTALGYVPRGGVGRLSPRQSPAPAPAAWACVLRFSASRLRSPLVRLHLAVTGGGAKAQAERLPGYPHRARHEEA